MHGLLIGGAKEGSPLPASGPKLAAAIKQAISQLQQFARRRCFDHEGWPNEAKLWLEILNQSQDRSRGDVAPNILKGDLAAPIGETLDGRFWKRYCRWFEESVAPELVNMAVYSGIPALQGVRLSSRKGGHPAKSESIFFLAYLERNAQQSSMFEPPTIDFVVSNQEVMNGLTQRSLDKGLVNRRNGRPPPQRIGFWSWLTRRYAKRGETVESRVCETSTIAQRRWQAGVALILVGIFLLDLCQYFQADESRGALLACSVAVFFLGVWNIYQANKNIRG